MALFAAAILAAVWLEGAGEGAQTRGEEDQAMQDPRAMGDANRQLELEAAESRIRAERRVGELLREDKKRTARAERLAAMDAGEFERLIGKWRKKV
jgi:hypothetical protein